MSSLILCHKKKAKNAYSMAQIPCKLYTLEELCYYLCNHLYLVDYSIVNDELCDWICEELELSELSGILRTQVENHGSLEQFVLTILEQSGIYTLGELQQIQDIMERLKNQKPVEKQKYKADTLLESGAVNSAISIYLGIIRGARDESVDGKFYGKVYASLGAAYGRTFLYEEAAKMYEAAYQICEEKNLLLSYLYACRCYMNQEAYLELLSRSTVYQEVNELLKERLEEMKNEQVQLRYEDTLENWKKQYRRISTGEI